MLGLVIVVVLGTTVLVGTTLGGRWSVAPPVLLLCAGAVIALVPALTDVALDPEVVLLLFLPPILYWESINTSLREIRANLRVVVLFSVVLVVVTMVTVSLTAQAVGIDAHAAWVLGAVLAPTDAAAVAGLAKELPRRTLTTLQGREPDQRRHRAGAVLAGRRRGRGRRVTGAVRDRHTVRPVLWRGHRRRRAGQRGGDQRSARHLDDPLARAPSAC